MRSTVLDGLRGSRTTGIRAAAAALCCALTACDNSPAAPGLHPAAIRVENVRTEATAPPCCADAPFTYGISLILRETAGRGATISQVTVTITDISGAATVTRFPAAEVFGTTRIPGHGILATDKLSATGSLLGVNEMSVRVTFSDDRGNAGSAQTSTALKFDLTGDWAGPLPIKTEPRGDWSLARASLVQSGHSVTGELTSRDRARFPLTGSVSSEWAPALSLHTLPGTSTCAGVSLVMTRFEFVSGRLGALAGHASGRCFGTVAGTFTLQRSS